MTPLLTGESRTEEAGQGQRLLRGRRHPTPVGDCREPRVIRAKASQSPNREAWLDRRLPNHVSKTGSV